MNISWYLLSLVPRVRGCIEATYFRNMRGTGRSKYQPIFTRTRWSRWLLILRQDPLEAILFIFGRSFLNFFLFKMFWKIWKTTPLLCVCAVVITLETKKGWKEALCFVEFIFFMNRNGQKRFSQNEKRRADLQTSASIFFIFACGLSYDLSKFSDEFTPFFRIWKTITNSPGKKEKIWGNIL